MKISTQKQLVKILLILVTPLILFAGGLVSYSLITQHFQGIIRTIFVSLLIILMIWFCFIIFTGLTKYKNEFLMNDFERKEKWKTLSPKYRKFYTNFDIFCLVLYSTLFLFGLFEVLIYKNWSALNCILMAIGLGIVYLNIRKKNK